MSEFDDPQLERLLGGAGGAFPDVNTALAQVQGRVRHIKRRRAMVASTAACVLLAAGAVFAIGRGDDRANLQPGDDGGVATSESETSVVTESTVPDNSGEQSGPDTTTSGSSTHSSGSTGSGSHGSGPSSSTETTKPTSVPLDLPAQTYSTPGGSITVKLTGGVLVLVSSQAADGFTLDSSTVTFDRIEFRWRSATDDQRVRIDLINGVPIRQV